MTLALAQGNEMLLLMLPGLAMMSCDRVLHWVSSCGCMMRWDGRGVSEGRSEKASYSSSSAMTWVTTIVAVLALYLATYPILFAWWFERNMLPHFAMTSSSAPSPPSPSPTSFRESWVMYCGIPFFMLSSVPPLDEPLKSYQTWWIERRMNKSMGYAEDSVHVLLGAP
jgi:hypothetical protein